MDTILLPQREVTPRYIKEIKERYSLSWDEMDLKMRYAPRSRMTYHAHKHPENYLNDRFKEKFLALVSKLEKERGHTHEITADLSVKHIPKRFRIAQKFVQCKGHKEWCTVVDKQGFCGEECKVLFKQKGEKRK